MSLEELIQYVLGQEKHFFTFCGKLFRTPMLKETIAHIRFDQFNRKIIFSEDLIMLSAYLALQPSVFTTSFDGALAGYVAVENRESTTMSGKRDAKNSYESYVD